MHKTVASTHNLGHIQHRRNLFSAVGDDDVIQKATDRLKQKIEYYDLIIIQNISRYCFRDMETDNDRFFENQQDQHKKHADAYCEKNALAEKLKRPFLIKRANAVREGKHGAGIDHCGQKGCDEIKR